MKFKSTLAIFVIAIAAIAQPALAEFTQNKNGEITHANGIPLPPMQTLEEARTQAQKEIAAANKAREAVQAANNQAAARNASPATPPQEVFYTGKPYIEETGQYAFLFRSYDPKVSRWTTADPSGFPDGANNHSYVSNTPNYAFDFLGFARQLISEQVDFHDPNCAFWLRDMGDGIDWASWYGGGGSPFSTLPKTVNPQIASLASTLVFSLLGLTGYGPTAQTWIAYGGQVSWKVYRDVQDQQTVWDFEFTTEGFSSWQRSDAGLGAEIAFTPKNTTGKLTSTVRHALE